MAGFPFANKSRLFSYAANKMLLKRLPFPAMSLTITPLTTTVVVELIQSGNAVSIVHGELSN
jgi:hypothetical protein